MVFHRLSKAFYTQYKNCEEILAKNERPYYVLLLEIDNLTYAIPLRSHITHQYCYIADSSKNQRSGLDYSKSIVITDTNKFIVLYQGKDSAKRRVHTHPKTHASMKFWEKRFTRRHKGHGGTINNILL